MLTVRSLLDTSFFFGVSFGGSLYTLFDGVSELFSGRVLGHGALEANEHARVLALAPVGLHVLIVEAETEGMVGVIPSGLVPLLRDGLAGQEVSDLEGLLVRLEVRVERVGHGHVGHVVGEVPGSFGWVVNWYSTFWPGNTTLSWTLSWSPPWLASDTTSFLTGGT